MRIELFRKVFGQCNGRLVSFLIVTAILGWANWASAQCELTHTLASPDPEIFGLFGVSAAISGDNVVVGAYRENNGAVDAGAAYLYSASTGALLETFLNPTPEFEDFFGREVKISGDRVLVGAVGDDAAGPNAGAAYLFDATTGALLRTILNPEPGAGDPYGFGYSVSLQGDRMLIGNPEDDHDTTDSGRAYLFNASSGALVYAFDNPSPGEGDVFGASVALSGNRILIGAGSDSTKAQLAGAAYLFDADSGTLRQTFYAQTPGVGNTFGARVAVDGDIMLISESYGGSPARTGSVHLYYAPQGVLIRTIRNPFDGHDQFGWAIAIDGDRFLVGAPSSDIGAEMAGVVHMFDTWTGSLLKTFPNPFPAAQDHMGTSVAVSGDTIVFGAHADTLGAIGSGSAFVYSCAGDNAVRGWEGYE